MNSDRYLHPDDQALAQERRELSTPLPAESYSKSKIPEIVTRLELFMDHEDIVSGGGNKIENHRKASQLFELDDTGAFQLEVLIEYDYNLRNSEQERYIVTFTIASMSGNEQKFHAYISIHSTDQITMLVSDYDVPYIDEEAIIANNERMRPATAYDVAKLQDFMVEILQMQYQQDSHTRD